MFAFARPFQTSDSDDLRLMCEATQNLVEGHQSVPWATYERPVLFPDARGRAARFVTVQRIGDLCVAMPQQWGMAPTPLRLLASCKVRLAHHEYKTHHGRRDGQRRPAHSHPAEHIGYEERCTQYRSCHAIGVRVLPIRQGRPLSPQEPDDTPARRRTLDEVGNLPQSPG